MQKGIILLLIVLSLIFCSISEANYINNPGFEFSTSNGNNNVFSWFTYNCTTENSSAYTGNFGVSCRPTQTGGAIILQNAGNFAADICYSEGQNYLISFFGKKAGIANGACEILVGLQVDWQQAMYEKREVFELTTEWQSFEVPFVMPAGASDMFFAVSFNNFQEEAMFDNIALNAVPEPTSSLMLFIGFIGLLPMYKKSKY
jgi:hypothetical protein